MRALSLYNTEEMQLRDVPRPEAGPRDVIVAVAAVGLCGTDFHIYENRANYHTDSAGRPIPFSVEPQILGHEFSGVVVQIGRDVRDLNTGDHVAVDQGLNCASRGRTQWCEYCLTGSSHQCADYAEHGITGMQGALAEYIVIPASNAIRIPSDLSLEEAALTEPLGCIIHASDTVDSARTRYSFKGKRSIGSVLIIGAGPAGLLFTQYLREVIGFDGLLLISEPNPLRRKLAAAYGATVIDSPTADLVEQVQDLTSGERIHYLIEAAGVATVFKQMPGVLRKQATVLLYGHGHHGADLGVLNNIQFLEPSFISPIGASGAIDADGRPATYRRALELLSSRRIDVSRFITHRYRSLEEVPRAFSTDRFSADYIKGISVHGSAGLEEKG